VKAKETTHTYTNWRDRLDHRLSAILMRLEWRVSRDGDNAVLSDDQRLIIFLRDMLDEGGDVTEYIREIADAE
jgi:hypothetical protein